MTPHPNTDLREVYRGPSKAKVQRLEAMRAEKDPKEEQADRVAEASMAVFWCVVVVGFLMNVSAIYTLVHQVAEMILPP